MSDATITAPPVADPLASFRIEQFAINPHASPANITLQLTWLTQGGKIVINPPDEYPRQVTLIEADIAALLGAISPNAADGFMAVANPALRFKRRALKWLIDNGKLTGVTAA